ncbi:hypothetical protein DM01DRAFT_1405850 [Hesseltinella vesiculosa]|uniref:Uncharacterized protein n=1 Tax=Hesseltinella vesiculosa TaxID=101127 RepID=A0A1X2GP97_9FUNG|nr:hypothetical protein DM01DRAFT_1405850 [Hesseltinella vesiculosa]
MKNLFFICLTLGLALVLAKEHRRDFEDMFDTFTGQGEGQEGGGGGGPAAFAQALPAFGAPLLGLVSGGLLGQQAKPAEEP